MDTKPTADCCAGCMTHILPQRASALIKCLNDLLGQMIMGMGKQFVLPALNNFGVYLGQVSIELGRVWTRISGIIRDGEHEDDNPLI